MIRGLRCIRLVVGDLDRSLTFYGGGLRFQVEATALEEGMARLRAGTLHLHLREAPAPSPSDDADGVRPAGGGIVLRMEIAGLDAYHDALVARGLEPTPPSDNDGARFFCVEDPDGYSWHFEQSLD